MLDIYYGHICYRKKNQVIHFSTQLLPYDYYGSYGFDKNENYTYNELLGQDYTFDFPKHFDTVSCFPYPSVVYPMKFASSCKLSSYKKILFFTFLHYKVLTSYSLLQ